MHARGARASRPAVCQPRQGSSRLAPPPAAAAAIWLQTLPTGSACLHFVAEASETSKLVAMVQAKGAGHRRCRADVSCACPAQAPAP